jgi:hypothetical protein
MAEKGTNHPLGDLKLFEPKGIDLRLDYPELSDIPEFMDLESPSDLLFVWWYANRTSPIIKLERQQRWLEAAKKAYGVHGIERGEVKKMMEGKVPEKIKMAIEVMTKFNPHIRLRAKFADQAAYDEIIEMINISELDKATIMADADLMTKRTNFLFSANSKLPDMVARIERGYSVTLKNKKGEDISYKEIPTLAKIIDELD